MFERFLAPWSTQILSLLRAMSGALFLAHGTAKYFQFPHVAAFDTMQPMSPTTVVGVAGALEIAGGALLIVGLFTRPVAFILSGMMAVAYFLAHAPQNFFPILNGGEPAVLFCFIFLYLAAAGGGAWSLDALRKS